jgi:uncharacterized HhH-GPD family protein
VVRPSLSASKIASMPKALYFTDDPDACKLLAEDPFALLVGFAIDQQVTVPKAFAGPFVLRQRVGTLDPRKLAKLDLQEAFRTPPAIHRFPGAMADRVRELAAVVAEDYGGDASRIWGEAADTPDLQRRIGALPGFGKMKVTALGSVLAKQFGMTLAEPLVPPHACLGEVDSPEALVRYQTAKREHKAKLRAAKF